MILLMNIIKKILIAETGQRIAEYALIISLIAVVIAGILLSISDRLSDIFNEAGKGIS